MRRMDFIYDPSLVLYLPLYRLDGASFMSKDAYGRLATAIGATWRLQGRSFDGVDDYISSDAPASLISNVLTFEAWVKFNTPPATQQVVFETTTGQGWGLGGGWTASKWRFYLYLGGWQHTGDSVIDIDTNWHHVIGEYDADGGANNLKLLVDLNIVAQATKTGAVGGTGFFQFGTSGTPGSNWFNGIIGEARAYNRIPSFKEKQQSYIATKWRYQ